MNGWGTQFSFQVDDTNRDGEPVPDVFVVRGEGLSADKFYDHLRFESKDFHTHVTDVAEKNVYRGRNEGRNAVFEDIVTFYKENRGMGEPSIKDLIDEWELSLTTTYTVTVSFDDVEGELTVTGVEAEDEEDACEQVSQSIGADWSLNYDGPGEIDSNPFTDSTIYISSVEAEEE
jgi:hypothetical protein